MGIVLWFFLFSNVILLSSLLWLLTFIGYLTNNNPISRVSKTQYECGFKTTTVFKTNIYINTIIALIFLLLYEIEFTLLIPFFFNNLLNYIIILIPIFFYIIFITFFVDSKLDVVEWVY